MKIISALAVALSLASAVAFAPVANAATAPKAEKPAHAACTTKDKKACAKHVARKPAHHKHHIKVAKKLPARKDAVKKS
jgi:hypothetical protein